MIGGTPVDVTAAVRSGKYRVTLAAGQEAMVYATVQAGTATGADAADVILTAASQLAPDHTDAYEHLVRTVHRAVDARSDRVEELTRFVQAARTAAATA